jgi:hypothetical protein
VEQSQIAEISVAEGEIEWLVGGIPCDVEPNCIQWLHRRAVELHIIFAGLAPNACQASTVGYRMRWIDQANAVEQT